MFKFGDRDAFPEDAILDPISFDDVILMLQNIPPERNAKREVRAMFREHLHTALEILEDNWDELLKEANPDDIQVEKYKGDAQLLEELAFKIRELLLDHNMWCDVSIYFNGKCLSTVDSDGNYHYNEREVICLEENVNPLDYSEYMNGCLSMSFEGPLYSEINYHSTGVVEKLSALLDRYGLYYELGEAWNLSCFNI